jgi:glycosyltransferase involved in cell wall biosynthesis
MASAVPTTAPFRGEQEPAQSGQLALAPTRRKRALIVSSFVLPHAGGVEQFVDIATTVLRGRGWDVRVLACRPPEGTAAADVTVPTRYLLRAGWPVPVAGWRALWREVGQADVVVVNGARNVLPNVSAFAARRRGRSVVFVLHGSGAPFTTSSWLYHRLLGSVFERLVVRATLRRSMPVSLSQAGVSGARRRYRVEAQHVPYPLKELPPARPRELEPGEALGIVWVGRLYGEKNPLQAVEVVERVRRHRHATLHIYGTGVLGSELDRLARDRPWLVVGGPLSWSDAQDAQAAGHLCLSTSLRDATQVAILEPLARGIPVVSTRVGDALAHYARVSLRPCCVEPSDTDAAAAAILRIAASYGLYREEFAANARILRTRHARGPERLTAVLETAAFGGHGA